MKLVVFAIYLGIGAMLHALFVGAQFDWSSAWTFGWLFGWPLMIVAAILAITALWLALVGAAWCFSVCLGALAGWRVRRRRRAAKAR